MNQNSQEWARLLWDGAADAEVIAVIEAINGLTASKRANRAAVMVACAQILAQNVTQAPLDLAAEIRAGVLALIDGFAMQSAVK